MHVINTYNYYVIKNIIVNKQIITHTYSYYGNKRKSNTIIEI